MATDIDKMVGAEPEDIAKKAQVGTVRDRAAEMPADELMPEKAMPMKETPKPFVIKSTGSGG